MYFFEDSISFFGQIFHNILLITLRKIFVKVHKSNNKAHKVKHIENILFTVFHLHFFTTAAAAASVNEAAIS